MKKSAQCPNWLLIRSRKERTWKMALAKYATTNLLADRSVVQVGSGTTSAYLMREIVQSQVKKERSLESVIITNNLEVVEIGREALIPHNDLLGTTQVILTGGALHKSLHSLLGPFAAEAVFSKKLIPDTVFLGAGGLTFQKGLRVTYQFGEELEVQEAFASRPTEHRVILFDHSKFKSVSAWQAKISPDSLIATTKRCTFITTMPDDREDRCLVEGEITAFKKIVAAMLHDLQCLREKSRYNQKDFALILVDRHGVELKELSTSLAEERKRAVAPSQPLNGSFNDFSLESQGKSTKESETDDCVHEEIANN